MYELWLVLRSLPRARLIESDLSAGRVLSSGGLVGRVEAMAERDLLLLQPTQVRGEKHTRYGLWESK